ncbi:hypothetical protein C8Q76DRAFT_426852 [Earliella scabrosa]|nr:hypothetical protein C8Q76DRAFT_426852 [Earliella scabrosa]
MSPKYTFKVILFKHPTSTLNDDVVLSLTLDRRDRKVISGTLSDIGAAVLSMEHDTRCADKNKCSFRELDATVYAVMRDSFVGSGSTVVKEWIKVQDSTTLSKLAENGDLCILPSSSRVALFDLTTLLSPTRSFHLIFSMKSSPSESQPRLKRGLNQSQSTSPPTKRRAMEFVLGYANEIDAKGEAVGVSRSLLCVRRGDFRDDDSEFGDKAEVFFESQQQSKGMKYVAPPSDFRQLLRAEHLGAIVFDPTRLIVKVETKLLKNISHGVKACMIRIHRGPQSGKTFTATSMGAFWDIKDALRYDALFSRTVAGTCPDLQKTHSQHMLLFGSFDSLARDQIISDVQKFRKALDSYVRDMVTTYARDYAFMIARIDITNSTPGAEALKLCIDATKKAKKQMAVVLDGVDLPATLALLQGLAGSIGSSFDDIRTVLHATLIQPIVTGYQQGIVTRVVVTELFYAFMDCIPTSTHFIDVSDYTDIGSCGMISNADFAEYTRSMTHAATGSMRGASASKSQYRLAVFKEITQRTSVPWVPNSSVSHELLMFYPLPSTLARVWRSWDAHSAAVWIGMPDALANLRTAFILAAVRVAVKLSVPESDMSATASLASLITDSGRIRSPKTRRSDYRSPSRFHNPTRDDLAHLLLAFGVVGLQATSKGHSLVRDWPTNEIRLLLREIEKAESFEVGRTHFFRGTPWSLEALVEKAMQTSKWQNKTLPQNEPAFRNIIHAVLSLNSTSQQATVLSELHVVDAEGKNRYIDVTETIGKEYKVRLYELKYVPLRYITMAMGITPRKAKEKVAKLAFRSSASGVNQSTSQCTPDDVLIPQWKDGPDGKPVWATDSSGKKLRLSLRQLHDNASTQVKGYFKNIQASSKGIKDERVAYKRAEKVTVELWVVINVDTRVWADRLEGHPGCRWWIELKP